MRKLSLLTAAALIVAAIPVAAAGAKPEPIRFATFNASLNRNNVGDLRNDLSTPNNAQAKVIAEIIQRTRPDVLLINEFDFDPEAVELFHDNYLEVSQNGAEPISYEHSFIAPSNTGVPSGFDLDNNGSVGGPNDAFGFGFFEGQFGMVVYSQYPIGEVRTFQNFLWKDMPGALLPVNPTTGEGWYSPEELEVFRLSSKSHWDLEIEIGRKEVHFLVSHPTPPVFDGAEDRNGTRNFDEIRFWADYTHPRNSRYIYDDEGKFGGIDRGEPFVIAGDQNSDPNDGDSIPGAIQQLLDSPRVNDRFTPTSTGGVWAAGAQEGVNLSHITDPASDTADFSEPPGNLRADYVLPSKQLRVVDGAVFWPAEGEPFFNLTGVFPFPSSDHRLVWLDVSVPGH
jgi:Endonuclease/Exonuclease/phosphatase family